MEKPKLSEEYNLDTLIKIRKELEATNLLIASQIENYKLREYCCNCEEEISQLKAENIKIFNERNTIIEAHNLSTHKSNDTIQTQAKLIAELQTTITILQRPAVNKNE